FLEGDDLRPRLFQRGHQPLVVLGQSGDLCLGGRQALFQLAYMTGALGQLAPNQGELLLEVRDLGGEVMCIPLPPCGARIRVVAACHVPPPRGLERRALTLTAYAVRSPVASPTVLRAVLSAVRRDVRRRSPSGTVETAPQAPRRGRRIRCRTSCRCGSTRICAPVTGSACSTRRRSSSSTSTAWPTSRTAPASC